MCERTAASGVVKSIDEAGLGRWSRLDGEVASKVASNDVLNCRKMSLKIYAAHDQNHCQSSNRPIY